MIGSVIGTVVTLAYVFDGFDSASISADALGVEWHSNLTNASWNGVHVARVIGKSIAHNLQDSRPRD